ncbi:[FeFe] hydrogenase, group A [Sporomusa termitida]|uniref:NADP-reducing hydrogenase subunit HndD n=1 Tax=Sporomusa termitida TaxID=2377 RepID=A0A517DRZ2_9FIRM|nr:[FeFe] hydrogenase, group A [Sporomusa termitida]QDR80078.1 NADP-reducing hydrogenase subunit HndD [Sporomusa termitida]
MQYTVEIDQELCTGCHRCIDVCPVGAIGGPAGMAADINYDKCCFCGQCVQICSAYQEYKSETSAPRETKMKDRGLLASVREPLFAAHNMGHAQKVWEAINNPNVVTMVQCAPAVRVGLAEDFGVASGELVAGKMITALRKLGFDRVYDTNFTADLTIMEEGSELIKRIQENGVLPMFTSCCPAWVKYVEQEHFELHENLSTCKSPQQMAGALFKTYGAQVDKLEPKKIVSVSVMPCTAKKFEASRPEMNASGSQDVDLVLTTRELANLIKHAGIDFKSLKPSQPDSVLGTYTGAGHIFGVTGGVMEAALRTGYELITGNPLDDINILDVRHSQGVKRATLQVGDLAVKTVVVAGLENAAPIIDEIKNGTADFHFVEVMACPQGCISGGGQPKVLLETERKQVYASRMASMYKHDEELPLRKSHDNPEITKVYKDFLGKPLGHKSHELLHTHYCRRG